MMACVELLCNGGSFDAGGLLGSRLAQGGARLLSCAGCGLGEREAFAHDGLGAPASPMWCCCCGVDAFGTKGRNRRGS
jgi:hypothetical protein